MEGKSEDATDKGDEDETGEKAADFGLNVQRKTIDQP